MTKTLKMTLTALAMTALAACDYVQQKEFKAERSEANYQKAMSAYEAGQLDVAIREFDKVVTANPGNASARFQLACLLMESKKDYLGAICGFREYTRLEPNSDKAELATKRAALCETALAKELAAKLNLTDNAALVKECDRARQAAEAAERKCADLEKEIAALQERADAAQKENVRLRRMISSVGDEEESASRMSVADAKKILDEEDDGDRLRLSPDAKALFQDAEDDDARRLARAEEKEEASAGSSLIAAHTSGEAGRKLTDFGRKETTAESEPPHEERPEFYVVEEGDTLSKIAARFYGRKSAWTKIREANKAVITTDGRVKAGQKLVLP